MNKKVIVLLMFIFLLCGCSSEVNINVDGVNINEDVNIVYMAHDNVTKGKILSSFREYIPIYNDVVVLDAEPDAKKDGIKYYERKINEYNNGYLFNYSAKFNKNTYKNARTVKRAFKSTNITLDSEDILVISTDAGGLLFFNQYPELDDVTINITTNNDVIETNGTKDGNKYSWKFSRDDNNKNIYIKMKVNRETATVEPTPHIKFTEDNVTEESFLSKMFNKHPVLFVCISLVFFVIVIVTASKISRAKYK